MNGWLSFIISSILFGLGLAVDAFLISLAGGVNEPNAKRGKILASALVFALFQLAAPLIGRLCVRTVAERVLFFKECLSGIALAVLLFLGIKMLVEGLRQNNKDEEKPKSGIGALLLRAAVSSVDALSMGFTIIGRKFGTRLADKAMVIGGILFIVMALEVFIRGF